jgi:hypothetical protein
MEFTEFVVVVMFFYGRYESYCCRANREEINTLYKIQNSVNSIQHYVAENQPFHPSASSEWLEKWSVPFK